MKKENKNIEVVKREYRIFRFFRIRKEAKRAMEEINKEGFGYVKPELLNILYKKGYSTSQYSEENGLYFVCTADYFNTDVNEWIKRRHAK